MRAWLPERREPTEAAQVRLELSGSRLSEALARLVAGCEPQGGVERYVEALKLKGALFRDALGARGEYAAALEPEVFKGLCPFMATVRRRIAPWLERPAFDALHGEVLELLRALGDPMGVDARLGAFGGGFAGGERERWVRDLAAELLHNVSPERFPLMSRWVWDAAANTGVLREIWFFEESEFERIEVADTYATFLTLREELSQFLTGKGFFRDVIHYVDLLCAQVYAEYICEQGGSYLRTDFASEEDPLQYTRRLLGLDGIKPGTRRTRLKTLDGEAFVLADTPAQRLLD